MCDEKTQAILDECKTIEENCLYTAQTHFVMAGKAGRMAALLLIIPSIVASLAGILTAMGLPGWIGAFAAIAGVVTGVATYCGIGRNKVDHAAAGNLLTCLRHEARAIHETYWRGMLYEQLLV